MPTAFSFILLILGIFPSLAHCQDKTATSMKNELPFVKYALSDDLSDDEIYTIELLIDSVLGDIDDDYYTYSSDREDERKSKDYKPRFDSKHLRPAANLLTKKESISLQRQGSKKRPIRDIKALGYFPDITWLALNNNEVKDLTPLANCVRLSELHLKQNQIVDLSPIKSCSLISILSFSENPLQDLNVLSSLPDLEEIRITESHLTLFKQIKILPSLRRLEFCEADSFIELPSMPSLTEIRSAKVSNLEGLQKFSTINNLTNLSGTFTSLEPLRSLPDLTHINTWCSVDDLSPFQSCKKMREISIYTTASKLDITPLYSLPALQNVTIKIENDPEYSNRAKEHPELEKLRESLVSPEDVFGVKTPRYTPSLNLEIVDQKTFNHFDTEEKFGVDKEETNHSLLSSELEWLDAQFIEALEKDFEEDEDFYVPYQWGGARSRAILLLSDEAVENFGSIVTAIQTILAHCHKDWIIYFQTDTGVAPSNDFTIWIYPDRIMATEEHEATIRRLVQGH